jgi:hypothetical protein
MSERSQAHLLRRYWWFAGAAVAFGIVTVIGQFILG